MKHNIFKILVFICLLSTIFLSGCQTATKLVISTEPAVTPSPEISSSTTSEYKTWTSPTTQPSSSEAVTMTTQTSASLQPSIPPTSTSIVTTVSTTCPTSRRTKTTRTAPKNTSIRATKHVTSTTTSKITTTIEQTARQSTTTHSQHPSTTTTLSSISGEYLSEYENQVLVIVNNAREAEGLKSLIMNESLKDSARIRAKEIVELFSHDRPCGSKCFSVFTYPYRAAGENIAKGQRSPDAVFQAWADSPGHKKNMFADYFSQMGVACFKCNGRLYWVQLFTN